MKTIITFFVLSFIIFSTVNSLAADPDLSGCWDVYIDQIDSDGDYGPEHNTIKIVQIPNDNRFWGFVSNLPDTEEGRNFSGIVVKKDVFITHWDSITKATLSGKNELSGVNQAFDANNRASKTAFATAIRLDTDTCCNEVSDGLETDVDCGGPCGGCFEGKVCIDNDDCLSGNCASGFCSSP